MSYYLLWLKSQFYLIHAFLGVSWKTTIMYRVIKTNFYNYIGISVILSPIAGFLSLVRVTQFSQFEKGILCPKS